jgi:hypothetical protein
MAFVPEEGLPLDVARENYIKKIEKIFNSSMNCFSD